MKIVKGTNVYKGIPNPGDVWGYRKIHIGKNYPADDFKAYMRIQDEEGGKIFYANIPDGIMYSLDFSNGEIIMTKTDDPDMEIYGHAELRL